MQFNGTTLFSPAYNSGSFNVTYNVTTQINNGDAALDIYTNASGGSLILSSIALYIIYGGSPALMQLSSQAGFGAFMTCGVIGGQSWSVGAESNNNFHVYNSANTGVYLANGGTGWSANSDRRLKKNLKRLPLALERLIQLSTVSFNWNEESDNDQSHYGVIAQEVQKLFPELVTENDKGMLGVNYSGLIPVIIAALQELKQENLALKKQLLHSNKQRV